MTNQYKEAEAYIHFGSADSPPMQTRKCKRIRRRAVQVPQKRHLETGDVCAATDYQINLGGKFDNHWRRVWISGRGGYMARYEGAWCPVSIIPGV